MWRVCSQSAGVLDCLNCETPPLGKPTLIRFINRLIKKELDRRLIDRTVEIAKQKGGFGSSQLKAALNSSPLWGSGKVEDTYIGFRCYEVQ